MFSLVINNRKMHSEKSGSRDSRIRSLLLAVTPSFFHGKLFNQPYPEPKAHPTSCLDGIRGFAAIAVFNFHLIWAYSATVEFGFGSGPTNYWVHLLPPFRLFFAAHAMVAVFFITSGYVLALKPLKLARSQSSSSLYRTIASSMLRRGPRLYGPALSMTLVTALTLQAGWWEGSSRLYASNPAVVRYADSHPLPEPSLIAQLGNWLYWSGRMTDLWSYFNISSVTMPWYNPYDPHLWTVPAEFRSGLILALFLAVLGHCWLTARLVGLLIMVAYCACWGRWEVVCYLAGAALAEFDEITMAMGRSKDQRTRLRPSPNIAQAHLRLTEQTESQAPLLPRHASLSWSSSPSFANDGHVPAKAPTSSPRHRLLLSISKNIGPSLLLASSIYFLCTPNIDIDRTPGYKTYSRLFQPLADVFGNGDTKRLPHTLGGLLLVAALGRLVWLRQLLICRPLLWVGRVSYAVYIVHGPLIHIVLFRVVGWVWWCMGVLRMEKTFEPGSGEELWVVIEVVGGWRWVLGILVGWAVLAVVVMWVADLFERGVERTWTKFGRWLEGICFY